MKTKIFTLSFILLLIVVMFAFMKPIKTNATDAQIEISNGRVVLNTGFNSEDEAFSHIIEKYKVIITFFAAIGAITMVAIFIYTFIKLGASSGNPQERQKCLTGLIITGLATALLGSIALFVGLFYNAFRDSGTPVNSPDPPMALPSLFINPIIMFYL